MIEQTRSALAPGMDFAADPELAPIFDRYIARVRVLSEQAISNESPALFSAIARAYARRFSGSELAEIRAFARTPAGGKFLRDAPDLLTDPDVAAANTAYMTNAFVALRPAIEELRRDLEAVMVRRLDEQQPSTRSRPRRSRR
jgi:hypothetical protein